MRENESIQPQFIFQTSIEKVSSWGKIEHLTDDVLVYITISIFFDAISSWNPITDFCTKLPPLLLNFSTKYTFETDGMEKIHVATKSSKSAN